MTAGETVKKATAGFIISRLLTPLSGNLSHIFLARVQKRYQMIDQAPHPIQSN